VAEAILKARPPVPVKIIDLGNTFRAELRIDVSLVHVSARRGQLEATEKAIRDHYGVVLPRLPRVVEGDKLTLAWAGPDQWLAMAPDPERRDLEFELRPLLSGIASVVDQTDGRSVVRISGTKARDVLIKGIPLDLHPTAFQPGHIAITHISHIGAIIWQVDAVPTYDVAVFRSFTESFADWLVHSAEEFAH
jgi:sarcosine oxidase subunit gamma